ncbi:MAG: hypothetical protein QM617_04865 [Comamonas sp.]
MDVSPIVARLQAQVQDVMAVGAAAELDAAMRGHARPPAVYVMPGIEKNVSGIEGAGCSAGTLQTVSVITVVDELGDATGGGALKGLPAIRRQILAALGGWTPDERLADPMAFLQGELIQFEGDGLLWWSDEYVCIRYGGF